MAGSRPRGVEAVSGIVGCSPVASVRNNCGNYELCGEQSSLTLTHVDQGSASVPLRSEIPRVQHQPFALNSSSKKAAVSSLLRYVSPNCSRDFVASNTTSKTTLAALSPTSSSLDFPNSWRATATADTDQDAARRKQSVSRRRTPLRPQVRPGRDDVSLTARFGFSEHKQVSLRKVSDVHPTPIKACCK